MCLKLIHQYDVQTYFFIKQFNEMKLQHKNHCVLKGITKKPKYFLFDKIYLIHI
jgi:hypothetical protein